MAIPSLISFLRTPIFLWHFGELEGERAGLKSRRALRDRPTVPVTEGCYQSKLPVALGATVGIYAEK